MLTVFLLCNISIMSHYISTLKGNIFDFEKPWDVVLDIEEIAHHLSMICRFNGGCTRYYSVAEHSVHISRLTDDLMLQRWALLHDVSEAFLGDMVTPFKKHYSMGSYRETEEVVQYQVYIKYMVDRYSSDPFAFLDFMSRIKDLEFPFLQREVYELLTTHAIKVFENKYDSFSDIEYNYPMGYCQKDAKEMFLRRFKELFGEE